MTNHNGGNGKGPRRTEPSRPRGTESKRSQAAASRPAGAAEPRGSALYEVLKGIDFEHRQLVGKSTQTGLFELVKAEDGGHRCYSCTLCERTCPTDCIELEYCPEFPEEPFDFEAARAAALATLPGESCGAASACVMGEAPAQFVPEIDMKLLDPVIAGIRSGSGLVEALHATQEAYGYLPVLLLRETDALAHIKIEAIMGKNIKTVPQDMTVTRFLDFVAIHHHIGYPVVNEEGNPVGWVTLEEAASVAKKKRDETLVSKIMRRKLVVAFPDETALDAFKRMSENETGRVLIFDRANPKKLIGVVTKTDLMLTMT